MKTRVRMGKKTPARGRGPEPQSSGRGVSNQSIYQLEASRFLPARVGATASAETGITVSGVPPMSRSNRLAVVCHSGGPPCSRDDMAITLKDSPAPSRLPTGD